MGATHGRRTGVLTLLVLATIIAILGMGRRPGRGA
jgi:hypothetical protein